MDIAIVVAMAKNRVIGKGGRIPWDLPADRARFKKLTLGHPVLMGRRTYESIGRPLPDRTNVVLTRNPDYVCEGCVVMHSIAQVLARFRAQRIFVIGGAEVFAQFLPLASELHVTLLDQEFAGDVYFPEIDPAVWVETRREQGQRDEQNPYDHVFLVYECRRGQPFVDKWQQRG
jgi:dihydrofolate reductase